ncbi:marine proteobacterial sortase target protein [Pseudoteredinibacter isoporae]|uniref:Ca-activated chloride channel family protein n=1 Tax=Pseudoteredinibacter isoporae TaxID=570281 RepID=A0A7X0JT59_9GAMM|nr:marine proteobacterial sortase target protein [Pseudoteredinibacter isoporae]MBB6520866.1 Ca-activated chloride channel family protein [Pseudoteredinibacter isoporae]NHO86431.1 marine proteobacterial sortase target protein [Pseudoteredinibacter isoporae]NIB25117.1 marine proteobacterial sortase target protein [Pseudoteredinibacter isoporae]
MMASDFSAAPHLCRQRFRKGRIPKHLLLEQPVKNRSWMKYVLALLMLPLLILFLAFADSVRADDDYQWQKRHHEQGGELFFLDQSGRRAPALHMTSDFSVEINGMVAEITLQQRFKNQGSQWLEAVYVFPLDEQAAISAMQMRVGERLIKGKIKEKQAARKEYQLARKRGQKAALSEQQRANLFTQRVANIAPGEEIEVELTVVQSVNLRDLPQQGGLQFSLRIPTTLTPRYMPGQVLLQPKAQTELQLDNHGWAQATSQVPDAAEISPPMIAFEDIVNPMSLHINLDAGLPLADVESPSHKLSVRKLDKRHQIDLANGVASMDRDFILQWSPNPSSQPRAALFRQSKEQSDYAMVMLLPPQTLSSAIPREVVFIIDTSGSMDGESIVQAKAALSTAIQQMGDGNRFNIIEFNSNYRMFSSNPLFMNPLNRQQALDFVAGLHSGGGTEMLPALREALQGRPVEGFLKQVVFITDGSVGNETELFREIHKLLGDSRLFTVGIGSAPNGFFMRKAAEFGRGSHRYISRLDQVEDEMGHLFKQLASPVLRDVHIQWPEHLQVSALPENISDLYMGEAVLVQAKLTEKNASEVMDGNVVIKGQLASQEWQQSIPLAVLADRQHHGLSNLWGRKKIAQLEDEKTLGRDPKAVKADVLKIALAEQLLSPYTSFIAVEEKISRPMTAVSDSAAVANQLPKGSAKPAAPEVRQQTAMAYPKTALGWELKLYQSLLMLLVLLLVYTVCRFGMPRHVLFKTVAQ